MSKYQLGCYEIIFVSTPSYYNYTACVYCEGWNLNDLYSGTRTHVLSQDLGLCQKVKLEKFCLNNYSMLCIILYRDLVFDLRV